MKTSEKRKKKKKIMKLKKIERTAEHIDEFAYSFIRHQELEYHDDIYGSDTEESKTVFHIVEKHEDLK